jgi:two-component system phosphate regulon response regulator PhoB
MQQKILVLDGDVERRALHVFGLCCAGFHASQAADAQAAHAQFLRQRPDLVLLFCERLDGAAQSLAQAFTSGPPSRRVPVVAVLAQGSQRDAAVARELGFADCLAGGVASQALAECVRACLGRDKFAALPCGLQLDQDKGILTRNGCSVPLGPTERRLLAALSKYPDRVMSRTQLQRRVGNSRRNNPGRIIDISVCRLRHALKRLDCEEILQTIRRRGYRLALRETRTRDAAATTGHVADDPEHFFDRRRGAGLLLHIHKYIGAIQ